jgi:hypothetical protein
LVLTDAYDSIAATPSVKAVDADVDATDETS